MSASVAIAQRHSFVRISALLHLLCASAAIAVVPQSTPNPHLAGFAFPLSEATLTGDIADMTRGDLAAARRIYLHAWGLWTAVTQPTAERYEGQALRVFETWSSVDDLVNGDVPAPTSRARTVSAPHRLNRLQFAVEDSADSSSSLIGAIKFDPTAANHIVQQRLLDTAALDVLLASGAIQIPPFPATALIAKPVYRIIHRSDLVAGRYYLLKVWSGPPDIPQAYGPDQWTQGVWVDLRGGRTSAGGVDPAPAPDASSRTDEATYSVAAFIHHRMSASDAATYNATNPDAHAAAGDIALLVAMHLAGRELARWTWQTFWWTPDALHPPAPSSAEIAGQRPSQLDVAAGHYAMTLAYTMLAPDQPYTGGANTTPAVYAYNPWIEAHFTSGDLPDSMLGFAPDGTPSPNNTGVQTNCMSCHAQATYHRPGNTAAPGFTGARYVDLGDPQFVGTLQTDFLWVIARHAR